MKNKSLTIIQLEERISNLKTRMITVGISKGLMHSDTIKYSQKLDILLNEYRKVKSKW